MKKLNKMGFTLVEIMIVVAITALLAAIAIPSLLRTEAEQESNQIVNTERESTVH